MIPETIQRLVILRQKAIDNTITVEELKEGVILMRGDRKQAAFASEGARRKKAKADVPNADDMLDELGIK